MVGKGLIRNVLPTAVGLLALAALVAHLWVNARAAADFRALGVPPFACSWESGQLWVTAVASGSPLAAGPLPGDRIVRIAGRPMDGSPRWQYPLLWRVNGRSLRRGQSLPLTVIRQGQPREVTVRLAGIPAGQVREVTRLQAMMLPKQLAGFCLWLLGGFVLLRRRDPLTRLFFLWCMSLALYTTSSAVAAPLWDCYPSALIRLFRAGFTCGWFFAPALFGHFCCVYAGSRPRRIRHLPALFYGMPLLALVGLPVLPGTGLLAGAGERLLWRALAASWLGTLALGLGMLRRARRQTADPVRRKQIDWLFAGSLAYALVVLHAFVTALAGWDMDPTTAWAWLPHGLLLVTPLAFADAVLRHRLLELDVVMRRSLIYTLLTLCMAGVFIVLQQLVGALLQATTGATSLPGQTFAAIVVAALFGPTERRLGRLVEALFNRPQRRRLEQLDRLGREIQCMDNGPRLRRVLVKRAAEVFGVESAGLYWLDAAADEYRPVDDSSWPAAPLTGGFGKSDGLAVWLALDRVPLEFAALERDERFRRLDAGEKTRLAALGVALCVPLSAGGQLAGFLTLGPRPDHDLYSTEEKAALLALGDRVAAALRQAELQQRVRALELAHPGAAGLRRRRCGPRARRLPSSACGRHLQTRRPPG